jgi:hypothetical protein
MGATAVVITGGHLDKAIDLLSLPVATERNRKCSNQATGIEIYPWHRLCIRHRVPFRGRGHQAVLLSKTYVAAAIANAHPGAGHRKSIICIACINSGGS